VDSAKGNRLITCRPPYYLYYAPAGLTPLIIALFIYIEGWILFVSRHLCSAPFEYFLIMMQRSVLEYFFSDAIRLFDF